MISSRASSQVDICGLQLFKNVEIPRKFRVCLRLKLDQLRLSFYWYISKQWESKPCLKNLGICLI